MLLRDCAFAQTRLSFCCSHNAHAIRNSPTIACLHLLNIYVSCGVAQARRGICTRSVRLVFFIDVRVLDVYQIMQSPALGDIRTP